jgi:hypothetical protein
MFIIAGRPESSPMFDFSPDEYLCLLIGVAAAMSGALAFYSPLLRVPLLGRSGTGRLALASVPPIMLFLTFVVLSHWADAQVAGHLDYELLFVAVAGGWMTCAGFLMQFMGISIRGDAIERNNPAAAAAGCGVLSAASIIFALSNVGGGPTIWTTILPAAGASAALLVLWMLMEMTSGIAESITVERDCASGLRFAGAMIGCALVLGRAAGGLWKSWDQVDTDLLRFGWPAIGIAATAALLHRLTRPSPEHPAPAPFTLGAIPGLAFIAAGTMIVALTPHGLHPELW